MKRVAKGTAVVVAVLVGLYLVAYVLAWILLSPVEQVAFFAAKDGDNSTLIFAHEGGPASHPTSTMVAFKHSHEVGSDVLDGDVHMTKDGVLVVAHDDTVDRTSNGTGAIRDTPLAQLQQLDFGFRFTADDGASFPFRGKGVTIVTLRELFQTFATSRYGLEMKEITAEAAAKLCDLIKEFGYEDKVLISSGAYAAKGTESPAQSNMNLIRERCASVATAATEGEVFNFKVLEMLGLIGFYSPPFDALLVPEFRKRQIITPSFLEATTKMKTPVVVWTVNETQDMERVITFGPHGIITDYPRRMAELLRSKSAR